jgi:hypothetical protein
MEKKLRSKRRRTKLPKQEQKASLDTISVSSAKLPKQEQKESLDTVKPEVERISTWITPLHQYWLDKPSELSDEDLKALRPDSDDEE